MDQYAIKNDRSKINDTVFLWFWFRNKLNETLFLKNIQNYFHNKSNELSIIHGILSNSIRKVYFWLFGNTGKYTGIRSLYDSGLSRKFKINQGSKKGIFIKIHSNNSIADNLRSFGVDLSSGLDIWRVFSVAINTFQLMTPKFDSEMTFFDLTSCWSSYCAKNDLFVVEGIYLDT